MSYRVTLRAFAPILWCRSFAHPPSGVLLLWSLSHCAFVQVDFLEPSVVERTVGRVTLLVHDRSFVVVWVSGANTQEGSGAREGGADALGRHIVLCCGSVRCFWLVGQVLLWVFWVHMPCPPPTGCAHPHHTPRTPNTLTIVPERGIMLVPWLVHPTVTIITQEAAHHAGMSPEQPRRPPPPPPSPPPTTVSRHASSPVQHTHTHTHTHTLHTQYRTTHYTHRICRTVLPPPVPLALVGVALRRLVF
jgi:hypothetical protein